MTKGWNPQRQAFVQHDQTQVLDASLLMMPLVGFVVPSDPMWLSTLDAMDAELVSDSLYAEEIGLTGEQLGNFPQALTHLSLINAAVNLDHQLDHDPGFDPVQQVKVRGAK